IGEDHFVTWVAGGEDAEEQERLRAWCDEHVSRLDDDSTCLRQVRGTRVAELGQAGGRTVMGPALAEGSNPRVDDMRRGWEVRLADFEMDYPPAGSLERAGPGQNLK